MSWLLPESAPGDRAEYERDVVRDLVRAVLSFNERGEVTTFVSDDRAVVASKGRSFAKMRWSTPLSDDRAFGSHRVMGRGQGVWHASEGEYAYLRLDLDAIDYTLAQRPER